MQYQVVRRLGRGGMGVVDLATAPDGSEVALKRLSLHGTPEEVTRARARIRREADVLRSLDHPGIVRLLDLLDDGDDVVLVMPYLAGGSLHERVARDGPMTPDAVAAMADRLLDALAAAHRQGVVHRDIKPENVLFTADDDPRLVDFGVARSGEHTLGLTATSMVVGTPGFMAPEQARGEPASPAADVFSLGATLHFALTGQGPFGPVATDPRVLMHRAATGKVDRPARDLPPDLRALLAAALDPRPDRRPSAARLRGGGPGGTRPRTGLADAVFRNRLLVAGGALAVVLLLAVVAVVVAVSGGDGGGDDGPVAAETTTTTERPTTTTVPPCTPLKYRPCRPDGTHGPNAPNTDGRRCREGFEDYDGDTENGCEAEPDGLDDPIELTDEMGEVAATIVPRDDVDRFVLPVDDGFSLTCDGAVTVTLTAPPGMPLEMEVRRANGNVTARGTSAGGRPTSVRVREECGTSDGDLTVTVRPADDSRVGDVYTLAREGSF